MVPRLILQFLGLPQVLLDDRPISTDRRKALALLAYLAVNDVGRPRQKYSRESLSALLWPDFEQARAFSSLRTTLWELRQAIGEGWLIAERESVQLNPNAEIDLDVARFRVLLSQGRQQTDPAFRIPLLSDAVKLYRDHFLTGFSLKDAPNFNEWAFAESEDLRRKLAEALTMLSEDCCALGQADQAIPYARHLVALDPLNESSHRQLMEVYWQAGQHSAALKQYQTCEQILRKEMNLDPQPETRALYKKILKGGVKPARIEKEIEVIAPKHNLPTGTVTFLFTDIEGSTKLAQQYPDALPGLLARHHEILNESFRMHGGYAFQSEGDSFAVAFHSADDALNAALAAQRSLHNETWSPAPIKVRMGIHTGTAELNPASAPTVYSGYTTMALTQRIMSAGHGGQILVLGATENLLRGQLPEDISLYDMGRHNFKDVLQPVHIFQVIAPGLPQEFPPLRTLNVLPNNLPAQLTSFVGREKQLADIIREADEHRLVTLTGPGGIGKTRLSLEVAHEMLNSFPNGVWFVELASLSDPSLIPQAIIATLGLVEQAGRSPLMILTDFLREKRTLLILDNCEHLIEACASLAETLLRACSSLHMIATSREGLSIAGERLYLVPSLTTPDPIHATPETLTAYEAVQLFVERAQATRSNFSITQENAIAIAQVCYHLDGIPLALELAAARVKGLGIEQIASFLHYRFRLLTGGSRTALPRHQTLQGMIDWSHDLLAEPERELLRRLSVFAGGWTLEAAEFVCGGNGLESDQILDLLLHLVDKSLVVAETQGREPRYHMLETIRQYAHEKLWAASEGEIMRERHLAYFVELAERAEPNLRAFDMVVWLDRLETELDNLRVALEWAQESDVESQLRLASALLWFWHIRDHKNEGIDWLERGLSMEAAERGDQPITPARAMIRGKALHVSGFLMLMGLELQGAEPRFEESLSLFQQLGPPGKQGAAYAILRLGSVHWTPEGKKLLEQSLSLFREMGDKFGAAESLMLLSARVDDDYKQAVIFAEEHLALRREIRDPDGIASGLGYLSFLAFLQNDYQQAITLREECLAMFRELGNKWALGYWFRGLGDFYFWQSDYEQATKIYQESLALVQETGDRAHLARNLYGLGIVAQLQGDYARATQIITDSLAMFRELDDPDDMVACSLHALGDIALAEGDAESALQYYAAELASSQERQYKPGLIFAFIGMGKVAWTRGDYEVATKSFEEVLRICREISEKSATFHALYGLGRVAQSQGDYTAAHAYYAELLNSQHQRVKPLFNTLLSKTYACAIAYPVDGFAVLAAKQHKMQRAARLLSAAETLYTPLRFEMSAHERAEHDEAIVATRAALGEDAFAAAWGEGKRMILDEAVSYALEAKE